MIKIIKAELDAFPATYGALSDKDAATLFNNVDKTKTVDVSIAEIERYLFQEGNYSAIKTRSMGNGSAAQDAAAKSLFNIFTSNIENINVNHVNFQAGLTALVGNDITQTQADAITAMGVKSISRASELKIGKVNEGDVNHARSI